MKKKKIILLVSGVAVVLLAIAAIQLFLKKPKDVTHNFVKIEAVAKRETFEAGSKLQPEDLQVIGYYINGGTKREAVVSPNFYSLDKKTVPKKGREFTVTVSLTSDPDVSSEITLANKREKIAQYDIGRTDSDDVQAILYESGEFEIEGKGEVKNYKKEEIPWKDAEVKEFSYISPEVELISLDYYFTGSETLTTVSCKIPESVRSMTSTFEECILLEQAADLTQASGLLDMTSTYEGCVALQDAGAFPENIITAKSTFKDCEKLKNPADIGKATSLMDMTSAYENCGNLTETGTPDGVNILKNTYKNCYNLKAASIPAAATDISQAYSGAENVEKIIGTLPVTCEKFSSAFAGCKYLHGTFQIKTASKSLSGMFGNNAVTSGGKLTLEITYAGELKRNETIDQVKESIERGFSNNPYIKIEIK